MEFYENVSSFFYVELSNIENKFILLNFFPLFRSKLTANQENNKNSNNINEILEPDNLIEDHLSENYQFNDEQDDNEFRVNNVEPHYCSECQPNSFEQRTKETTAVMALMELIDVKDPELNPHLIYKCGEPICSSSLTDKRIILVDMIKTDQQMNSFTGTSFQTFENIVKVFCEYHNSKVTLKTTKIKVMMCLCKLRLNLNFLCLSVLFNLNEKTCANYFYSTVKILAEILSEAVYWPSKKEILCNMPKCFKNFKNTVAVLDCTEILVQVPSCLTCRIRLYSQYKGTHTVKVLISVSPSGQIIGVSAAFGGRASDKAVFDHSRMIENFSPGVDAVMTDKGFEIETECIENNIKLWRPPKLEKRKQFTYKDYELTKTIASARVHVERSIQRVKIFKMFQSRIQWNLMPHLDDIFTIICGLVNLSPPILGDEAFFD